MQALQTNEGAARWLAEDRVEDVLDRLSFLRHSPGKALVIGDDGGLLAPALAAQGVEVTLADVARDGVLALDEEAPYPVKGFDLIVSLGTLDTVNDLPGALIHLRHALAPGGLALISMMAAGSLPVLRSIMLEADGERPAARLHPAVDVRSGAQLLQRVGLANPVADARGLDVRFGSLGALVSDLRAQGWAPCWPMPRRLGQGGAGACSGRFCAGRRRAGPRDRAFRNPDTFRLARLARGAGWRA
jgi:SAM-dependent methyltransferase